MLTAAMLRLTMSVNLSCSLVLVVFLAIAFPNVAVPVTFVNELDDTECSLLLSGRKRGPRQVLGTLAARGGSKTIAQARIGQIYVFVRAGTLDPLVEHEIRDGVTKYTLTKADMQAGREAEPKCKAAELCRVAPSCAECTAKHGCGWSVVRHRCFEAHPIATENNMCTELPPAASHTVDEWLQKANILVDPLAASFGPAALRKAYQVLERAGEAAELVASKHGAPAAVEAKTAVRMAINEISPKLEAVFDDDDAHEALAATRSAELHALHPRIPMVARRSFADARAYIARGEPVIITDLFVPTGTDNNTGSSIGGNGEDGARTAAAHPIAHKWTLAYLERHSSAHTNSSVASESATSGQEPPRFGVFADSQEFQYFQRRSSSKEGYPYPFVPHTHIYRDTFAQFSSTLRSAANGELHTNAEKPIRHYLHDVLMGGKMLPTNHWRSLSDDINATTTSLLPVCNLQPFFGGIMYAKLWVGQRGIVTSMHHDTTDNLYVMAWGRKRALLADPGQLSALGRYPNRHPLVGSALVNASAPNLTRHPGFVNASLRELVIGPGDVLYLPAWWWHQFEQPFEDTATLNLWSYELSAQPGAGQLPVERDERLHEITLHDKMEAQVAALFGNADGTILDQDEHADEAKLARAVQTLYKTAKAWRGWLQGLPGGVRAERMAPSNHELVIAFLENRRGIVAGSRWPNWAPGTELDLGNVLTLPAELQSRCKPAPENATYISDCW